MKKKTKIIIGIAAVLLIAIGACLIFCCKTKYKQSALDFKEEYEKVNGEVMINDIKYRSLDIDKNNPYVKVSIDEIAETVPSDSDGSISDEILAEAISRFLKSQDEKYRKVFIRRYWYGDPISKIAEYYGMKEKTVATYLFRTRKKLKEFLQKEGYDYE